MAVDVINGGRLLDGVTLPKVLPPAGSTAMDVLWIDVLSAQIAKQARYAEEYNARYTGERVLELVRAEYREVYGNAADGEPRLAPPRTGIAAIGVDALVDRLLVDGFEAAPHIGSGSELVRAADAMWSDNDLDIMHVTAERESLIAARSFGLVWPGKDRRAVVTIESAEQVAVHRQPAPPYDVDVALKLTVDEWTGLRRAYLWYPTGRREYVWSDSPVMHDNPGQESVVSNWDLVEDSQRENPFGDVVPVVELADWKRLTAEPTSSIEPVASLVDEADLCEALKVFAGHFGAVPIRYATGLPIPRDPKDPTGNTPLLGPDGRPIVGFNARADHLWTSTSKDTTFGQLTPATLDGFVAWSKDTANKIRAKTAVPEFYYGSETASHMTGEVLKVAEAPMIRRVLAVRKSFTQGIRRIASLGLHLDVPGIDPRAVSVLPRWANPETRIEAAATDAFQKQVIAGVPIRIAARETLGWGPDVIDEMVRLLEATAAEAPAA